MACAVGDLRRPDLAPLECDAGLMTGWAGWDEKERVYTIGEETNRFVGMIGSPAARDVSLMPYQEEPRDVPVRFVIEAAPDTDGNGLIENTNVGHGWVDGPQFPLHDG